MRENNDTHLPKGPLDILKEHYLLKKKKNSLYSLSAFARDLSISRSQLSRIMSGKRPLTLKFAMLMSTALNLDELETNQIVLKIIESSSKHAKISNKLREKYRRYQKDATDPTLVTTLEIEQFKAMSSWYHLAILNLARFEEFKCDPTRIAKQLKISKVEAESALDRLFSIKLLKMDGESVQRTKQSFHVATNKSETAVREFHKQMIGKALDELTKTDDESFNNRLINGTTISCGHNDIEKIKEKVSKLQNEIVNMVSESKDEQLYQINVQLFPLTNFKQNK